MFNVELSDIRRKIGSETKHINCAKCGEHLGHKREKPPRPPFTEPSIVYRVRWNSLLEWDGDELIEQEPPYAPSLEGKPAKIRNTSKPTRKRPVRLISVSAEIYGPKKEELAEEPIDEAMIVAPDLITYLRSKRSKTDFQADP